MKIPSRTELERFFDAEQAGEVHFIETVASWPSLRILDYLYANEPATTGDIARTLNMDMRDTKDYLSQLESHRAVKEMENGWKMQADHITITLTQNNGLEIAHTIGEKEKQNAEPTDQQHGQETNKSLLASFRQSFWALFR